MTGHESNAAAQQAIDAARVQRVEFLQSLRGRQLPAFVDSLMEENQRLKAVLEAVTAKQEELRQKLASLCAPEHYLVVITKVTNNGSLRVEVATHGGSRVQVAVHPDVARDGLVVGRRGIVSKDRNCLLHLEEAEPEWQDVAVFEDHLDGRRRMLLKDQDQLVAVTRADQLASAELKKGDLVGFDRTAGLAYARLEPPARAALFADDIPTDDFSQLGGLERPIAQVKRAIDFGVRFPEVAQRYGVRGKRGILLCGPPGNGKTRIGRCAATYVSQILPGAKCRFMSLLGASDVYSMWLGESERKLRELFAAAEDAALQGPVVLFFDEIDALGSCRGSDHGSSAPDRILSTFLGLLDGVKRLKHLIVLAASNRPSALDPALIRPGRFDLKINIPAPDRRAARLVLQRYLENLPRAAKHDNWEPVIEPLLSRLYSPNSEYAAVATVKLSDGRNCAVHARELVSGALLENVVRVAAEEAAAREVQAGGAGGITDEDLFDALHEELHATTRLLTAANVKSYVASLPRDAPAVAVSPGFRSANTTRYLR